MWTAVKGSVEFCTAVLTGKLVDRCSNIDKLMAL
jgi:hypothetical protein